MTSSLLSQEWSTVRFRRATKVKGAWVLLGIPQVKFEPLCARLFVLKAQFLEFGISQKTLWVAFRCPAQVAGKLASVFPAPTGSIPLLISKTGYVLTGRAETQARTSGPHNSVSRLVQVQAQATPRLAGQQ